MSRKTSFPFSWLPFKLSYFDASSATVTYISFSYNQPTTSSTIQLIIIGYFTQVPVVTRPFREAEVFKVLKYLLMSILVLPLIKSIPAQSSLAAEPQSIIPHVLSQWLASLWLVVRCLQCKSIVQ